MKNLIGIMQGRLSPAIDGKIQAFPWDNWELEFYRAEEIGLDLIDWIVEGDRYNDNPLLTPEGVKTITETVSKTGVRVGAVCADFFMDYPLIRCTRSELKERMDVLDLMISQLKILGIPYLEIPLVDNSAVKNELELEEIAEIIKPRLDMALNAGVTFAFETSLTPAVFRAFLLRLDHPSARANYDMGNSASLGYDPNQELDAYGEWVVTVHVKDRVLKGGTVPLGEGDTDFAACFSRLKAKMYKGPYILQVARSNNDVESAKKNISFVNGYL